MRRLVMVTALAMVGLCVPVSAAGAAGRVMSITSCGQVITTDAVLRTDLVCSGDALTVVTPGVSVRLAGHSITSSDGTGTGVVLPCATAACPNINDVVIRDGTISGFHAAVEAPDGDAVGDRLVDLTLTNNTWAVYLTIGTDISVVHTTVVGPNGFGGGHFTGVAHISHSRIDVTGTVLVNYVDTEDESTIDSSRIDGGGLGALSSFGIVVSNSSLTNVAARCAESGIAVSNSRLRGYSFDDDSECVQAFSHDRFIGPGAGVGAQIGGFDTVTDSVFTGWDTAIQIVDSFTGHSVSPITITGNRFQDNGFGVVGCTTGPDCSETTGTISDNQFLDNAGTGLLLTSGSWHVGSNRALRNGGLGIDAEGPELTVFDDGGNVAARNQPPQCIGVVCAP